MRKPPTNIAAKAFPEQFSRQEKPPAWLHRKSRKQRERDAKYYPKRDAYMAKHPFCEACEQEAKADNPNGKLIVHKSTDCHHRRGKLGPLYWDDRFFMAVCRYHHIWVDANRKEAIARGWLAGPGEWNVQPKPTDLCSH